MRIYLVRHGESTWNGQQRIQGRSNPSLSARGLQQSAAVARRLRRLPVDRLVTSPLRRARQTAEAVGRSVGKRIEIAPELAEIALGEWEGLTSQMVDRRYNGRYQRWLAAPSATRVPGAETIAAFRRRVARAFQRLIVDADGAKQLCLVTHGGVITAILSEIWQADFDRLLIQLRLDNTGVTLIEAEGQRQYVMYVNDTSHLNGRARAMSPVPFPRPSSR